MPKALVGDTGKLKLGASGKLADKACCCVHECLPVGLACDSVAITKDKCGYDPLYWNPVFGGDGNTYTHLLSTCRPYNSYEDSSTYSGAVDGATIYRDRVIVATGCEDESQYFNGCATSGSVTLNGIFEADCAEAAPAIDGSLTVGCFASDTGCTGATGPYTYFGGSCSVGEVFPDAFPGSSHVPGVFCVTAEVTLSNEYTDAGLINDASAALPAYDGSFTGLCYSRLHWSSSNHRQVILQRFRYKFTFPKKSDWPSWHSGYLKIYWTERSTPEGGGSFSDTAHTWEHLATDGETDHSPTYEVLEPATAGRVDIVNVRWSWVQPNPSATPPVLYVPILRPGGCDTSLDLCDCDPGTDDFLCCEGSYPNCCDPAQDVCDWINCDRSFREPLP